MQMQLPERLQGMTQRKWNDLSPAQRQSMQSHMNLSHQLIGLEGKRVEVETEEGETKRFKVGKSTGWAPCHLELHNSRSTGGGSADKTYKRVTVIR